MREKYQRLSYLPISVGRRVNETSFKPRCVKFLRCVNPSGSLHPTKQ